MLHAGTGSHLSFVFVFSQKRLAVGTGRPFLPLLHLGSVSPLEVSV